MAILDAPDLYGHTLFCDDIRAEADGKMTFVGVYGNQLFVHGEFPVTLPKFAFGITFIQKKRIFEPNLGIRIFVPQDADDAPSIQADMSEHSKDVVLAGLPQPTQRDTPADQATIVLQANLIFAPFTILAPGAIKVRIARRGDFVRVGALAVDRMSSSSTKINIGTTPEPLH